MKYLATLQALSGGNAICAGSKETPKVIALKVHINIKNILVYNLKIEITERGKFQNAERLHAMKRWQGKQCH